jgi:Dyp-type peroxidase family
MSTTPPLFQLTHPLTPAEVLAYETDLERLQGNILKSHGRNAAAHLFVTFTPGKVAEVRRFLRDLPITSAAEQQRQIDRFKRDGTNAPLVGLYLSATGYAYLGASTAGFSREFQGGMRAASGRLSDVPVGRWQPKYQREIHAMILLAHDDVPELTAALARLQGLAAGLVDDSVEMGQVIRNKTEDAIEHFGYADGLSQPLFFADQVAQPATKHWDPSAGPSLVLVKDPLGNSDQDCGTYFVFRKLEQDVRGFKEREQALADALELTGDDRKRAGALVVGRFQDGTPVALTDRPGGTKERNDFAYPTLDVPGDKCPFVAHIRKTNPRGDSVSRGGTLEAERKRRIARRGITYGPQILPGAALPEGGVGLLFQCCQSSLAEQFEFLQGKWANNDGFVQNGTGRDPVIGQSPDGTFPAASYPPAWNAGGRIPFDFHGFVTLRGGEYFFAPSLSYVKNL